ncbi:MAG TPA: hypothetical protein PK788_03360 [Gemmatimonadaceae bacterium]|nr:hypothetical protein [Gemmatimonadaceae bacterium]HRQ77445.1 hypothetical protein [Gemmatimonadaceae bacterium]
MKKPLLHLTLLTAAIAIGVTMAPSLAAQDVGTMLSTRAELEAELARREQWAQSTAYSERLRARAQREAAELRARLTDGDFRVGDRLLMRVDGRVTFNDTLSVTSGRRLIVPGLGTLEVGGLLRSELQARAQAQFRESVLDAVVAVRPLARLAVFGSVGGPGYQSVPLETRVDELLMGARGPGVDARPERFSIQRGDTTIVDADGVQYAIAHGATIGDLGLRDGDYLLVEPGALPWDRSATMSLVGLFLTPVITRILIR